MKWFIPSVTALLAVALPLQSQEDAKTSDSSLEYSDKKDEGHKKPNKVEVILKKNRTRNGRVELSNLHLLSRSKSHKKNEVQARPGELILGRVDYRYGNSKENANNFQDTSINQIILGIDSQGLNPEEDGAKVCLCNGFAHQIKEGQSLFSLTAPTKPGEYHIRFRYAQAYNAKDAVRCWWGVGPKPDFSATIGRIIVKEKENKHKPSEKHE